MAIASEGKFVWFDFMAQDVAKAAAFYGELFQWKTQDIPVGGGMTYTMLMVGDQGIGGMLKAPPGSPPMGYWVGYLSVDDVQGSADQIKSLGGTVIAPPMKQGDFGTMAVVADPLGGVFALWRSARPESNGDFAGKANHWVWNELYTQDEAASFAFYSKVAGWTEEVMNMPSGAYHVMNRDGKGRAGMMKPPMPMPQVWMPYVQVDSCDATIERAKKLGATVHMAGDDVPGIGRIGLFSDPQGGMIGILQPAPM